MIIKRLLTVAGYAAMTVALFSCGTRRSPGRAYMPDMTYSRAYETYAPAQERLNNSESDLAPRFNSRPVEGTVARGEMLPYKYKHDSSGYRLSSSVKNPLDIAAINLVEAERLYLINCGICHGPKLDGNGPLYNGGNGPFAAAPKNFMADDMKAMAEGTMFHSVTFGKGQMGSYASQLTPQQRWMVIAYIKSKQAGAPGTAKTDSSGTAAKAPGVDSATVKKG